MGGLNSHEHSELESFGITRYKVIFIGDSYVGKTGIINSFSSQSFHEYQSISNVLDNQIKYIELNGKTIKLEIWDLSGRERFRSIIQPYVRNSSIAFLVYDVTSKLSFDNIPKWIDFIKKNENKNTILILCGNKIDLGYRQVTKEEGRSFAKKEGIAFFEVSAKTHENIENMFNNVTADLESSTNANTDKNKVKELLNENEVNDKQKVGFTAAPNDYAKLMDVKMVSDIF